MQALIRRRLRAHVPLRQRALPRNDHGQGLDEAGNTSAGEGNGSAGVEGNGSGAGGCGSPWVVGNGSADKADGSDHAGNGAS